MEIERFCQAADAVKVDASDPNYELVCEIRKTFKAATALFTQNKLDTADYLEQIKALCAKTGMDGTKLDNLGDRLKDSSSKESAMILDFLGSSGALDQDMRDYFGVK